MVIRMKPPPDIAVDGVSKAIACEMDRVSSAQAADDKVRRAKTANGVRFMIGAFAVRQGVSPALL